MSQSTIEFSERVKDSIEERVLAADQANQVSPVTPQFWESLRELAQRRAASREFEDHETC